MENETGSFGVAHFYTLFIERSSCLLQRIYYLYVQVICAVSVVTLSCHECDEYLNVSKFHEIVIKSNDEEALNEFTSNEIQIAQIAQNRNET